MTTEEVTAFIKEWQQVKPQLTELTALKEDLAIILAEVDMQADLNNLPPQYAGERQVDHIEAEEDDYLYDELFDSDASVSQQEDESGEESSESGMPMPGQEDNQVPERQFYAAHLAYFMSLSAANQGWKRITRQFPALVETVQAKVFTQQQGGQTLYSLRVGAFETETATRRVCQVFNTLNFQCMAVNFEGENITAMNGYSNIIQ
ncbi:MAG: SPOR domain-containing protein [Alteromonadaceae bacterium]|nr:SPOR domain-containing protein [Alteromonadaceae bacterium]